MNMSDVAASSVQARGPAFEFRPSVCAACGEGKARAIGWRGGAAHQGGLGVRTQIVRCQTCAHLYPNPMPYPVRGLSDLYGAPDEFFSEKPPENQKRLGAELLRGFEARLGGKGKVLDVGCGRGELLRAAFEAGWEYDGLDPSAENLQWAREQFGIDARLGTFDDVRFPAASFDVVTMGGVIEHLYDPLATLEEIYRILKPGGLLWFDAPNENGLFARLGNLYMKALGRDWVVNLAPTFPPYHVQGFGPRSLRRIMKRAGFRIERLRVWGGMFPQKGSPSLRKRLEFHAARLANSAGNLVGAGSYMSVWSVKPRTVRRGLGEP
jgi:SAM-dependent methyltransferase